MSLVLAKLRTLGATLGREPLVHFIALAALLFVLDYAFSATRKEQILVNRQTAEFLIKQREELELRQLTPGERQQTIVAFVEDEILYSEAYKRGLDKGDSRMRRNLILKMRGLLIGDIKPPGDEQLREYFEANREKFTLPPTLSLEQVFYSDPSQAPKDLLDELRAGRDPAGFGDPGLGYGRMLPDMSDKDLAAIFGAEAARIMVAIDDEQWHGPIESIRGVHFVHVTERQPARKARYEDVKSYLEGDWMMDQSRKAIEQEIERLRDGYDIVIEDFEEAPR